MKYPFFHAVGNLQGQQIPEVFIVHTITDAGAGTRTCYNLCEFSYIFPLKSLFITDELP